MRNELGNLRRSQVISSHGPGAIIDFRAGGYGGAGISVVAAGLEAWDEWAPPPGLGHPQSIFEPRLQERLGVDGFRLPPVAPQVAPGVAASSAGKLVGVRFPNWLQCPNCGIVRIARRWTEAPGDPALYCASCSVAAGGGNRVHVVPVRFVVACENGHLDEFPWEWWVRHKENCPENHDLKLEGSATAGLAGYILSCLGCGSKRSLEGCFGENAIPQFCAGKRPWVGVDADETCTAPPRVLQRGASNLYFSVVESALDIPPWSDALQKRLGVFWARLQNARSDGDRELIIDALRLPEIVGIPRDQLAREVNDRVRRLADPNRNLRYEEYEQLVRRSEPFGEGTEFEIRLSPVPTEIADWIDKLVRATRLREVRAICGFTRIQPPIGKDDRRIARISATDKNWLPGVEVRGEGIFLQLASDRLPEWESREPVKERALLRQSAYEEAWRRRARPGRPQRRITPRLLLVHSLAHALIRQLALDCGYNSASLRERLYVDLGDWDMAGLLIYTSSPDSDGTLGGLVRQGTPENVVGVLQGALQSMSWCSSDPLCIEGTQSLSHPLNGAACHACMLASETSCEEFNAFLDRAFLVGSPDNPDVGFFRDYLEGLQG